MQVMSVGSGPSGGGGDAAAKGAGGGSDAAAGCVSGGSAAAAGVPVADDNDGPHDAAVCVEYPLWEN